MTLFTNFCCPNCWTLDSQQGDHPADVCDCGTLRVTNTSSNNDPFREGGPLRTQAIEARRSMSLPARLDRPQWLNV